MNKKYIPIAFLMLQNLLAFTEDEEKNNYPIVICPINSATVKFVKKSQPHVYAEFGISIGNTASAVAKVLPEGSKIYLFDYFDKVESIQQKLIDEGFSEVYGYGNSYKLRDSYNWSLMKLLQEHNEPIFDYVYLDGMHTWDIDGFAFLLIDQLLKPGGYIDFDDYGWNLRNSPTLNPQIFPLTAKLYTDEQIDTPNVKLIINLLVKRNKNYTEIVRNKIFKKKIE